MSKNITAASTIIDTPYLNNSSVTYTKSQRPEPYLKSSS